MKKLKAISLISIGAISILGTNVFATKGIVKSSSGLILRSSASKESTQITTLSDKTEVEILQEEGEWYKVVYNNNEGYLFKEYVTKVEEEGQSNKTENEEQTTSQIQTNINVYKIPLITSTIIDEIQANETIEIIKQITNWSYIKSGEIEGWVRTAKIQNEELSETNPEQPEVPTEPENPVETEPETPAEPEVEAPEETIINISKGYVNVDYANVRKEATTSSDIVTTLTKGTSFTIVAETEEWYKLQYMGIDEIVYDGYIFKELVSLTPVTTSRGTSNVREETSMQEEVNETQTQEQVEETSTQDEENTTAEVAQVSSVVEYAKQYLGYPYVYGGTKPETGFDCTGFTYYIYNACGYSLSRSCSVQAQSGVAVSRGELQPGDLLLFNNTSDGSIGHVGIYIGNGQFIHAANPRRGVVIDTIESGYYNTYYYLARRIK